MSNEKRLWIIEARDGAWGANGICKGELVRCGECKWWKNNRCDNPDVTILEIVNHNWFCADGERKDGETEQCNTYSLGKIEMPKGAIEQIIADGERKDGERRTDGE